MRTLSTPSKLLAYVAAALGVLAALGLPWFGASPVAKAERAGEPVTLEGPTQEFFGGIWRHVSEEGGITAYARFEGADTALVTLIVLGVLAAGLAALRGPEVVGRWLMRVVALAVVTLIAVKVVQVAATDDLVESRRGAVIAFACGAVMLVSAGSLAQQTLRRRAPAPMTALHDPTLAHPRSAAPPGP